MAGNSECALRGPQFVQMSLQNIFEQKGTKSTKKQQQIVGAEKICRKRAAANASHQGPTNFFARGSHKLLHNSSRAAHLT